MTCRGKVESLLDLCYDFIASQFKNSCHISLELFLSSFVAPQILIVLFLIYLFDNIIQLISLRSLWYYGGW
jgi:hypothetical protein